MGTTNYGTQTIKFDFKEPGKAENFNKLNYKLFPTGIYSGGLLTKSASNSVQVGTLTCFIEDITNELSVSMTTANTVELTVAPSTPYIVLSYAWSNTENNYIDFKAIAYADLSADDLVVGKCIYIGGNLQTSFDYSRRTKPYVNELKDDKDKLRVIPLEPYTNKVHVYEGKISNGNKIISVSEQDSGAISDTTDGRIDLVYIDSSGVVQISEGVDAVSLSAPTYEGKNVIAEIERGSSRTFVTGDDITNLKEYEFNPTAAQQELNTHKSENITAANTVHGIQQGTGNGFDADTVDGYNTGNASGDIPISNGTVNTNLNAEKVDGQDIKQLIKELYEDKREVGTLFTRDIYQIPVAWSWANRRNFFPAICLDTISTSTDISETNWPDLVSHLRNKVFRYMEGTASEVYIFDVTDWAIVADVATLTFMDIAAENAILAALAEDNLTHTGGYTNWRSVTLDSSIGDISAGEYAITDVDAAARTISFAFTAENNSGAVTASVKFFQHRVPGSTTTARLFEMKGRTIVSANDSDGENIAGMMRRDRMHGHRHELYTDNYRAANSAILKGPAQNTASTQVDTSSSTSSTVNNMSDDPGSDGTNGTPRTGKTTDPRSLVGHTYMWAGDYQI